MTSLRRQVADICANLPGAALTHPWGEGHDAWKIGNKVFASFGSVDPGVAVKTADVETAQMLIEIGAARRAKYFHRSWVNLPEGTDPSEVRHRLLTSYDLIRAGLTKKAQAALAPREEI